MQEQKFLQLTDKLYRKGYNLYPFDSTRYVLAANCSSIILGTQEKTRHSQYYYVFLLEESFQTADLDYVRKEPHFAQFLYDLDEEYLAYQYHEQIDPRKIDLVLARLQAWLKSQRESQNLQKAKTTRSLTASDNVLGHVATIAERLSCRGYQLHPYSQQQEIKEGRRHLYLFATNATTSHQIYYVVALPMKKLSLRVIQSIQHIAVNHPVLRACEVHEEYLIFQYNEQVTPEKIDSLLDQLEELHGTDEGMMTQGKVVRTQSAKPAMRNIATGNETRLRVVNLRKDQSDALSVDPGMEISTSIDFDPQTMLGAQIDGYTIHRQIGMGGFGVVYLVTKNGLWYVMKMAKSRQSQNTLAEEIHALQSLNALLQTPEYQKIKIPYCVPKLYAHGEIENRVYFVEEFVIPLDMLKKLVYSHDKVKAFEVVGLMMEYYQGKANVSKKYEKEKYMDRLYSCERIFSAGDFPVPIDPLVASYIVYQLAFLIYIMNINNYQYGDIKSENVGIRLNSMDIIDARKLAPENQFSYAINESRIAEQLTIKLGEPPAFCPVLIDFGSFSKFNREGDNVFFVTPKYMVPNEILMKSQGVRKSFIKDPYTLGLLYLNLVSGLDPFWDVKLAGNLDQQIEIIKALYQANETPFDTELLAQIVSENLYDVSSTGVALETLKNSIFQYSSALMGGTFKEGMVPIVTNMQKLLSAYHHGPNARYLALKKGPRVSEYDEVSLRMQKGSIRRN